MKSYKPVADKYADDVIAGTIVAGKEVVAACERYKKDLKREDLELRASDPDTAIKIIEGTLVHQQGERLDGTPLLGQPLKLEPFQIFIIYNLLGFFYRDSGLRRYKEAFIMMGRKNGKTSLVASIAWAVAIMQRKSGSKTFLVANALKQTLPGVLPEVPEARQAVPYPGQQLRALHPVHLHEAGRNTGRVHLYRGHAGKPGQPGLVQLQFCDS